MNIKNVINKLANYKVDVYSDGASRANITDFIKAHCGISEIYQGQKRIVIKDTSSNEPMVYKIAYSTQGIEDNIFEVAFGIRLTQMLQSNKLSQDQFNRFGIARLVNNDPFMVSMKAVTPLNKDSDFEKWYETEGRRNYPDYEKNKTILIWLSRNKQLSLDYNAIQVLISELGVGSDSTMNEPLNFGTVYENGRKRLVIIDLGSVIPILTNKNRDSIRPKCPICGHDMRYIPIKISQAVAPEDVDSFEGRYGCNTPNCDHYYQNVADKQILNIDQRDSVVFSEYISTYRDYIRIMKAVYGKYYLPYRRVTGFNAYRNALSDELGRKFSLDDARIYYNNYQFKMVGDLVKLYPEINQIVVVKVNGDGKKITRPYTNYRQSLCNFLVSQGEQIDEIAKRASAISYLIRVCDKHNKLEAFNILSQSDENSFIKSMSGLIGPQESKALYNDITI